MKPLRDAALMTLLVGMLGLLTGCPSLIANVVSPSESLQQAIDRAEPGDTVRFMGTHEGDITVDKDGLTLRGDNADATIMGKLTVTGDRVTAEAFAVDGDMILDGDNGEFGDMRISGVLDTPSGSFEDGMFESFSVGEWGLQTGLEGFGSASVRQQASATISGNFSCDTIVQPSESIQTAIDNTDASADRRPVCVAASKRSVASSDPDGPPLLIEKSVNLQAMGPVTLEVTDSPIEGFLIIVFVDHDNARFAGFEVTTAGLDEGIGVRLGTPADSSANAELANLTISRTRTAVSNPAGGSFQLLDSTLSNNQIGISITDDVGSADVEISRNNIVENATGIRYISGDIDPAVVVNAERNWFGAATGPEDTQSVLESGESNGLEGDPDNCTADPASEFNASGTGDQVVDGPDTPVDYCPWATSSF